MTTAADLRTVAVHWPDLAAALGTTGTGSWPPAGRMSDHIRDLDERDLTDALLARLDDRADTDPAAPGPRRPPIRLDVYETMRTIEEQLHDCADAIASAVQRPPMTPAPRTWPPADRARRDQLARADRLDPRRWKWAGRRPSAQHTALWLLARWEGRPGPFRPLTGVQRDHIASVAHAAAARVETTLDIGARRITLEPRHGCGGRIDVHGGADVPPTAHCTGCGRVWQAPQRTAV